MSKINKEDFDEELQGAYKSGKIIVSFKYKKWKIRFFNFLIDAMYRGKKREGVTTEHTSIKSRNGNHDIPLVIYKPLTVDKPLPIMLYMHGGGYVSGSPEMSPGLEDYIAERPCIIVAPKYRRALKAPYPAALNDCYDTLLWIKEQGQELGGLNDNIMVVGNSAGGGLAAAVTLKNRDEKDINIAFQMPLYPMLDHRVKSESALMCEDIPIWNTRSTKVCWEHYLKDLNEKNEKIPAYASPSLNLDYADFPPTISFVGELEPFRDEVENYIDALQNTQIPTKFKRFPKAFHGFEAVVPEAKVSIEAKKFLLDSYVQFYDEYLGDLKQ